jgi:hypothetical protein
VPPTAAWRPRWYEDGRSPSYCLHDYRATRKIPSVPPWEVTDDEVTVIVGGWKSPRTYIRCLRRGGRHQRAGPPRRGHRRRRGLHGRRRAHRPHRRRPATHSLPGKMTCYIEMGDDTVGTVDANFLSGPAPPHCSPRRLWKRPTINAASLLPVKIAGSAPGSARAVRPHDPVPRWPQERDRSARADRQRHPRAG